MTEEQFQTLTTDRKVVPAYQEFVGTSKVYFIRSIDRREGIIETTQKQSDGSNTYYRYENLLLVRITPSRDGKRLLTDGDQVKIIGNHSRHVLDLGSVHILDKMDRIAKMQDSFDERVFKIKGNLVYESDLELVGNPVIFEGETYIKQDEKIDDYEILL